MADNHSSHFPDVAELRALLGNLLGPEAAFLRVILIYSVAISLLSLAIPISVQLLIDSVANTGLLSAIVTIGLVLFLLLLFGGALHALRAWSMELFNRRLYGRLCGEIALQSLLAPWGYFEGDERLTLLNRYFDIMTVKKNIPYLLSQGFTLLFQSLIGFVVVSLYHPYFLVFSLVLLLLLWAIWRLWGWKATESGFALSEAKHVTAGWLQELALRNGFYHAGPRLGWALQRTDTLVNRHIDAQQAHFRHTFSQLMALLLLYALASAALLCTGGWLVLQGQLTLGQLVAAELIMSAIFYGLPQLAAYLEYYYDLAAAAEELGRFARVPVRLDESTGAHAWPASAMLQLGDVTLEHEDVDLVLDCTIPAGAVVRVAGSTTLQRALCAMFKRQGTLRAGYLAYGDLDLRDVPTATLREHVFVLERNRAIPLTIRDYLRLAGPDATEPRMHDALDAVGLASTMRRLPLGLATRLDGDGAPLTPEEVTRLNLAFALLGQPRIVVLGQIHDLLDTATLQKFIRALHSRSAAIVFVLGHRERTALATHVLELGPERQTLVTVDRSQP